MDSRERKAREIQQRIGEVLLRSWDPLGVANEPEAADEYTAYVGGVYRLLATGASEREIAEHLVRLETEQLGYRDSEWRMLVPIARRLRKLNVRLAESEPTVD